jgi:O-antigen/teichoic acid export membrane protein
MTKNNSYRSIFKATGVFGVMQILRQVISIVSSKFAAIYLGPIGIGIISLLTNAINVITAVTNFEFLKIATREVALHYDENDRSNLSKTINILQKMAIFIGLLGGIIVILFSKSLSYFTFGNYDRQHWFLLLSIYLFLTSFSNARIAILQGINNIKIVALSNVLITLFTSIGTIIIYYLYRIEGIIWVLLYTSVIQFIVTIFFTRKFSFSIVPIRFTEFYTSSNPIFKLGFFLSLNLIFGEICNFIIKLYLNQTLSGLHVLGYFQVSIVILVNYLGLVFNAMAYDFYPKLTAVSNDNSKVRDLVNNQIEIALIIVTPAIIFLYLSSPFLIELLYSHEFVNSFLILKFALFSVIIKAIILPIAYIVLAKGNKKQYFKQELFSDFINLTLTIGLYHFFGLEGIGVAFIINYLVYTFFVYSVVHKEYNFYFLKSCLQLIKNNLFIGVLAVLSIFITNPYIKNPILILLLMISLFYSYKELNKRIDFVNYLRAKFVKK